MKERVRQEGTSSSIRKEKEEKKERKVMKNNGQKEKLRLLKPDATGHREGIEQSNRGENREEE